MIFWKDPWFEGIALKDRFPRLFHFETDQEVLVKDRIVKHGDSWVFVWSWHRPVRGRTLSDLQALESLLCNFKFHVGDIDTWKWRLQSSGNFSTKVLSNLIDEKQLGGSGSTHLSTLLNYLIPKKVEIFIWRLRYKRLPVKVELDKRGLDLGSIRCSLCDVDLESVDHIFLHCPVARDIWGRIFRWNNISNVNFQNIEDICRENDSSSVSSKIWQGVKWAGCYFIWQNRNNNIFKGIKGVGPNILNELQVKTFEWISKRSRRSHVDWNRWLLNPKAIDDQG
ncbi:uncharacterized protein [Rutidosis leptorrhynchoides]|uniref:uncharacterized protein n=1 Tax=Rutidosis leptorrhynchoides TaxID=125765 RepID=UPI003A9A6294